MQPAEVGEASLRLTEALRFPVPAGTGMMNEEGPNLFDLRGSCENVSFSGLTLDGGRTADDPPVAGHDQLCGIFVAGPYSYSEGPTGPPARRIEVRGCIIRNFFGRGVAFYAVAEGVVANCRIEDTVDEAIDFDHFVAGCRAVDNEIARSRVGVELNDANESWVARNRFTDCEIGVNLWRWCKFPDLNRRNVIAENIFSRTKGTAIQIAKDTELNVVRGNIITDAGRVGIGVAGSGTLVVENIIQRAGLHGIAVTGDENEIRGNHVIDAAAAEGSKADGILASGSRNRIEENTIRETRTTPAQRSAISNDGTDNVIR